MADADLANSDDSSTPTLPPGSWPAWASRLVWALVIFGAILRIARFLAGRALWLDETYLADNLLHRGLADLLLKPLDHWQAAPAGFLVLEHAAIALFGSGERALRLPALICSLASLPLFVAVARRCLAGGGAILAVGLFAVLGSLIYYGSETKQYSGDVLAALAVTWAALRAMEKPLIGRWALLGLIGTMAIFISQPAVFILAGVGLTFFSIRGGKPAAIIMAAFWAIGFWFNYHLFLRPTLANPQALAGLRDFWAVGFMPRRPWAAWTWLWRDLVGVAQAPDGLWITWGQVTVLMMAVGTIGMWRTQRRKLAMIILPLLAALAASSAHAYPVAGRVALFLAPALLMLAAAGFDFLRGAGQTPGASAALVAAIMIAGPSTTRAIHYLIHPPGREESRAVYQWIGEQWKQGDQIYLTHFAQYSLRYYESRGFLPEQGGNLLIEPDQPAPAGIPAEQWKALAGRKRVWIIFIHNDADPQKQRRWLAWLEEQGGVRLAGREEEGASAYLYDLSGAGVGEESLHN